MEFCSAFPNVFVFFYYLQNPGNISHKKRKTVQGEMVLHRRSEFQRVVVLVQGERGRGEATQPKQETERYRGEMVLHRRSKLQRVRGMVQGGIK